MAPMGRQKPRSSSDTYWTRGGACNSANGPLQVLLHEPGSGIDRHIHMVPVVAHIAGHDRIHAVACEELDAI